MCMLMDIYIPYPFGTHIIPIIPYPAKSLSRQKSLKWASLDRDRAVSRGSLLVMWCARMSILTRRRGNTGTLRSLCWRIFPSASACAGRFKRIFYIARLARQFKICFVIPAYLMSLMGAILLMLLLHWQIVLMPTCILQR